MDKSDLRKKFASEWKKHYRLDIFEREGFERKVCVKCGKGFWTCDKERKLCGDTSCENYSFLGNTITKENWDYIKTWKEFENFFVKNGHESIKRYPVVSRWRPDLFFTIASIQDFQRLSPSGLNFEYPASSLIVPQICLRFGDISNVGVTGKHFTCFDMIGQHSFNYPKEGYWKEKCIELNFMWFTKVMGIPKKELTYIEDVWSMPDLSAFGPCMETFSRGLELVNSVFMEFIKKKNAIKDLPIKVIDVGWGHERLTWFTNGTPTSYEAVFGDVLKKLKKESGVTYDRDLFLRYAKISGALDFNEIPNIKATRSEIAKQLDVSWEDIEKKIAPLEALYAITDHAKTLAYSITDGGLPSNVSGGYNLRVILRRALDFIRRFNFPFDLQYVCELHADDLKKFSPELIENTEQIKKILEIETLRYRSMLNKTEKILSVLIKKTEKGHEIPENKLIQLYDSYGITPELLESFSKNHDLKIKTPSNFYAKITEMHSGAPEEVEYEELDVGEIEPTEKLYYQNVRKFSAKVKKVLKPKFVILDRTGFYPRSGGQDCDLGKINDCDVLDVFKHGEIIIHRVKNCKFKAGQGVNCLIDWERREQLMQHHTATHIVNAAARKILGKHVWQAGAEKTTVKARLDITHYQTLNRDEIERIEKEANKIVNLDLPVEKEIIDRSVAEKKYGFRLYQGGAVPSEKIRIIKIGDLDIEACGGTHVDHTSEVGAIKIIKTERIQDGVVRIEFVAGKMSWNYLSGRENLLLKTAAVFSISPEQVPKAAERFFHEWKSQKKEIETLSRKLAFLKAEHLENKIKNNALYSIVANSKKQMIQLSSSLVKKHPKLVVVLANPNGEIVGMCGKDSKADVSEVVKDICARTGGKGGGRKDFAQGKGELSKLRNILGVD